jgi:hypothetical protein
MARGKGPPPAGRRATKGPVVTEAPGPNETPGPGPSETPGPAREGCPEEVAVVGSAAELPTVGQPASLTLAADRPQLVVGGRVASILTTRPGLGVVTQCLQLGETYLGKVTDVSPEQFEARLTRGG